MKFPEPRPRPPGGGRRVLITFAEPSLSAGLADALKKYYSVHLAGRGPVKTSLPFTRCDLDSTSEAQALVRGKDLLVHVAESLRSGGDREMDFLTRGTYNLLLAAAREGVKGVVLLGSLDVMGGYGRGSAADETWRPRPTTQPSVLAKYSCELICREFARENRLRVFVLRLGRVSKSMNPSADALGETGVLKEDVAQAVFLALMAFESNGRLNGVPWAVFHIQSEFSGARFSVAKAKEILGFESFLRKGRRGK